MMTFGLSYALSYLVGLSYPAYGSYRALCTPSGADDAHWLTYWVCYAFISTAEVVVQPIFSWVPFYYELKLVFLAWLMAPQTKGAQVLFDKVIKPLLVKHASQIDPVFRQAETVLNSNMVGYVAKLSEQYGPEVAQQAMKIASQQAAQLAQQGGAGKGGYAHVN